ncbi:MAG: AMP-binding protein [Lachnospiraceae bacterium]|nr:AMP-binding protein [Lachnospiraceae bacterium]
MTDYHIGSYKSINAFVREKLSAFREKGFDFETLFLLMFRERDNILYERSEGFRVKKATYGEAREHILCRAATLRRLLSDAEPGAAVGLHLENSLEWIECFWAILAAGFRPLLLNLRLPRPVLEDAISTCGCIAVISEAGGFSCMNIRPEELPTEIEASVPVPFGTELFVMSSGTTENVKICAYGAEELYYQIADSYEIIKKSPRLKKHYNGELKLLTFLPFYHIFGLVAMYIWFAFFSRTFVHLPDLSPQTIVNTIKRHKVTHVFAVPLFWEKVYAQAMRGIADRGEKTAEKFNRALALQQKLPAPLGSLFSKLAFREVRENLFGDSIIFMISGGSFLDPAVQAFFNGIGYRLANGYGMTEIGITSVELSRKKIYLQAGCVGTPMKGAEYMIDESGELRVRGRVIAKYVLCGGRKLTAADYPDGWYATHDMAELAGGHYRICGRRDDLIVGPGGENLNPNAIEPLLRLPSTEVCLIPANKGVTSSAVLLAEVTRHIPESALTSIRTELIRKIDEAGLSGEISGIVFVCESLIKPDEFKPNRLRLARSYAEGTLEIAVPSQTGAEDAADELQQRILPVFAAATGRPIDEISPDSDFFMDLGGSSIDYFAMLSHLKDEFGVTLEPGQPELRTVRGIADRLRSDMQSGDAQ